MASPPTVLACTTLACAALARAFGPVLLPDRALATLAAAGALWVAASALFLAAFGPVLARPRADGKSG